MYTSVQGLDTPLIGHGSNLCLREDDSGKLGLPPLTATAARAAAAVVHVWAGEVLVELVFVVETVETLVTEVRVDADHHGLPLRSPFTWHCIGLAKHAINSANFLALVNQLLGPCDVDHHLGRCIDQPDLLDSDELTLFIGLLLERDDVRDELVDGDVAVILLGA